jgi:hypothetical protein
MSTGKENVMAATNRTYAVGPREKKNICAQAAFVFAWHRIGMIGAYEDQRSHPHH